MSGKTKEELTEIGAKTQFSSEYQPANPGRKPDTISGFLRQEIASDGLAVMEGELLDDKKNPTGKKVFVRVKLTTGQAVAKRLLANANAGREKSIEMVLDRTEGKVPQDNNNNNNNREVRQFDYSKLTDDELDTFLLLSEKAKNE